MRKGKVILFSSIVIIVPITIFYFKDISDWCENRYMSYMMKREAIELVDKYYPEE